MTRPQQGRVHDSTLLLQSAGMTEVGASLRSRVPAALTGQRTRQSLTLARAEMRANRLGGDEEERTEAPPETSDIPGMSPKANAVRQFVHDRLRGRKRKVGQKVDDPDLMRKLQDQKTLDSVF